MVQLRPYQLDISDKAAAILSQTGLVYLAMETRTGKTLTAFETIYKFGAKDVLFVTKKKAIKSIESDYAHYRDKFRCTVINYESVTKCEWGYDLVVIDEAHGVGCAYPKPSKRAKDLLVHTKGKPIIYLSATPTPESFSQIYHQLYVSSFSPFKHYRNFYAWAKDYVDVKKKYVYNREMNDYSGARMDKIQAVIAPYMLTYTQHQAGFTETISERVLTCPMSDVQKQMIDRLMKDKIITGKSGAVILGDTAVKLQSKVHQICSGTVKTEDGEGIILSRGKAVYIKEYFDGQKIAVFYKFQAEGEMLRQVFDNCTESPEEFQAGSDKTFIGQFQSAREGIRLDTADAIVFLNIDFSAISYLQSRDRIISKERTKQAVLYWVFSQGGIEEKIYRRVVAKQDYTLRHFKRDYHV